MPKLLLVCANACGSRALGDERQRWMDVILTDLHRLGAESNWCHKTQDRSVGRQEVEDAVLVRNIVEETREKEMKDESKRRREQHAAEAVDSFVCPVRGCPFIHSFNRL